MNLRNSQKWLRPQAKPPFPAVGSSPTTMTSLKMRIVTVGLVKALGLPMSIHKVILRFASRIQASRIMLVSFKILLRLIIFPQCIT